MSSIQFESLVFQATQYIIENSLQTYMQILILGILCEAMDPDIVMPASVVEVFEVALKVSESRSLGGQAVMYLRDFKLCVACVLLQRCR